MIVVFPIVNEQPLTPIHGKPLLFHVLNSLTHHPNTIILCIAPHTFTRHDIPVPPNTHVNFIYLLEPTPSPLETCIKGIQQASYDLNIPVLIMDPTIMYNGDIIKFMTDGLQQYKAIIAPGCRAFATITDFLYPESTVHYAATLEIPPDDILSFATPEHILCNVTRLPSSSQSLLRVCFDLDNTLVTTPTVKGDYTTVKPIHRNIDYLRALHQRGHTIIIHTARRMLTHRANVGKVIQDIAQVTLDTLKLFQIPYDELYFGKPYADAYVDDKAISAAHVLSKDLGIFTCEDSIPSRSFNTVTIRTSTVTKKSLHGDLRGEIHYYLSIPSQIQHYFPKLIKYDHTHFIEYDIERIYAPTVSRLYVNEMLSPTLFKTILTTLGDLHKIEQPNPTTILQWSDIHEHYISKLTSRTNSLSAASFPSLHDQIAFCKSNLAALYTQRTPTICMIHGDSVFTNIFTESGAIKFIDMPGHVGSIQTIYGDRLYDYAKIFQSLLGYDEILHDTAVCHHYKSMLLDIFWEHIHAQSITQQHVRMMTHSLLLSLLPLHEPRVAQGCYKLARELSLTIH